MSIPSLISCQQVPGSILFLWQLIAQNSYNKKGPSYFAEPFNLVLEREKL